MLAEVSTTGLAIVTPIIAFFCLQLRSIAVSDIRGEYHFGEYMGFRIVSTGMALLFIVAISLALPYDGSTTWLILLIGASQAVEAFSDILYARLQSIDRMDRIARSQIIRGPLSLLALVAGFLLTGSLVWGVFGMFVARSSVLLLYDLRPQVHSLSPDDCGGLFGWHQQLRPRFALPRMGNLFVLSFPLGFVALFANLSTNVPRYFIVHSLGRSELGIFSAVAFLMSSGNLFSGALATSAFVRMATSFAAGHLRDFRRLLFRLLGVGTVIGVAGILVAQFAGTQLLTILYKPEYARQPRVLVGLMVVAWLGYLGQFLGYGILAARYFRSQVTLCALVVLVIAACSYWLIPRHALSGAILSMLLGTLVQLAGGVVILFFAMRQRLGALAAQTTGGTL